MLKQASVDQIRAHALPRDKTLLVITMRYYPRGIKKEWRDDFRHDLAPDRQLFKEWKKFEKQVGHDRAFELSHYEERFSLSPSALQHLKQYADLSRTFDVFLICQCKVGERCHREMLMLMAQKKYNACIAPLFHDYPTFNSRLSNSQESFS